MKKTYAEYFGINMDAVEAITAVFEHFDLTQADAGIVMATILAGMIEEKTPAERVVVLETFKTMVISLLEVTNEPKTPKGAGTRTDDPPPSTRNDH